jgi:hypothetical protein
MNVKAYARFIYSSLRVAEKMRGDGLKDVLGSFVLV